MYIPLDNIDQSLRRERDIVEDLRTRNSHGTMGTPSTVHTSVSC